MQVKKFYAIDNPHMEGKEMTYALRNYLYITTSILLFYITLSLIFLFLIIQDNNAVLVWYLQEYNNPLLSCLPLVPTPRHVVCCYYQYLTPLCWIY